MQYQAIIFDLDGTLADTIALTVRALQTVTLKLTGKELSGEEVLDAFGPPDTDIIQSFVDNQNRDQSVKAYVECFEELFNDFVKPIPGIVELFVYLKEREVKVGLYTGRSKLLAEMILRKLDLKKYLDILLFGEDVSKAKPSGEGIIKTLHRLGVSPDRAIYIGDFRVDILASRDAGVTSVLALWAQNRDTGLIEEKPDAFFESPLEMIQWLEKKS